MTSKEAFEILVQVVSQVKATPQEHKIIAEALRTLAPKEEVKG